MPSPSDPATAPAKGSLAATIAAARPRPRRRLLIISLSLAAAALATWFFLSNRPPESTRTAFLTEPLTRGSINLTITATGNLEPTNKVTIGSELSGTTTEVYVDINDRVTRGQPLARITVRRLLQQTTSSKAAINAASARVAQVEAALAEFKATLERRRELHRLSGGQTPSKADMIAAEAAVARSQADLGSAHAEVAQAQANMEANEDDETRSVIRSPIDGIVLKRSVEPGQTVAASFTAPELFIIAESLEHMKLKVAVAEADIGRVQKGQLASFTVDAWPDRSYSATVTKVSFGSKITDNVVTYETELEVSNNDLSLRPGMTATADIRVADATNELLVPNAALRFDPAAVLAAPPKKTFLQSLIPSPPRRGMSGQPAAGTPPPPKTPGQARVFLLLNGQPHPVTARTGLSDARFTVISGENLTEGTPVITRAAPPSDP